MLEINKKPVPFFIEQISKTDTEWQVKFEDIRTVEEAEEIVGLSVYIESDENQAISDSLPKTYLSGYKTKGHFLRVMKSHLISVDKNSPVWSKDVKYAFLPFLNIRAKLIIGEIEKCAGVKLFEQFEPFKRI